MPARWIRLDLVASRALKSGSSLSLHPAMCDWPLLPAMAASLPRCLPPQGDILGLASLTEALLPMAQPFPHHLASVQARALGRIL